MIAEAVGGGAEAGLAYASGGGRRRLTSPHTTSTNPASNAITITAAKTIAGPRQLVGLLGGGVAHDVVDLDDAQVRQRRPSASSVVPVRAAVSV